MSDYEQGFVDALLWAWLKTQNCPKCHITIRQHLRELGVARGEQIDARLHELALAPDA